MSGGPPRLFGTDGIRGPFGEFPLDRSTVRAVGRRVAESLDANGRQPTIVIGGDTRASTPVLARWLSDGIAAAGGRSRHAGVVPTPAVAVLTQALGTDAGIALSASHNPHPDNGIKLFDAAGFKWSRVAERRLEERLAAVDEVAAGAPPETDEGDIEVEPELAAIYRARLRSTLPAGKPLEGLTVALDTANGAATPFAASLLGELGARVHAMGDRPDGENINRDCGSTRPERLVGLVRESGSDLGLAFDGDADRVVLVDETGSLQDGDTILYLWATDLARRGALDPAAIVATTMSNLGLERALESAAIEVVRCDVGDRVVVETLRERGLLLGGEQSGHVVHLGLGTTGDGLITALAMARLVVESGRPLSQLAAPVERFPQVLLNVRVPRRVAFDELPSVSAKARQIERRLGEEGRLLLRYSGTEPLARVMIEGRDQEEIERLAADLADEIGAALASDPEPGESPV